MILGLVALFSVSFARAETVTVVCQSFWDLYTECRVDGEIERAQLMNNFSNSRCIEGQSWGYRRGGNVLWVAEGCRGQFRVRLADNHWEDSYLVRCESIGQGSRHCDTGDLIRHVELERQLSGAPCRLGRGWDWDRYGIYVNNGCRGIFRVYTR